MSWRDLSHKKIAERMNFLEHKSKQEGLKKYYDFLENEDWFRAILEVIVECEKEASRKESRLKYYEKLLRKEYKEYYK